MTRSIAAAIFVASTLFFAAPTLAQDNGNVFTASPEPALAQSHPLSLWLGLGPIFSLNGGDPAFKLTEGLDYHFSGTDEGFHAGLMLAEVFPSGGFGMQIDARAGWDFKFAINSDLSFGVDPFFALGFSFISAGGMTFAAFDLEPGVDLKLLIGPMWYVMLRPIAFEIAIRDQTGTGYDLMIGGGARL